MDEQKKEISVDDILREYEAMAEEPDRASRPSRQSSRTEIRSGGRHSSPRPISPIRRLRRRPTGRQRRRPRTGEKCPGIQRREKEAKSVRTQARRAHGHAPAGRPGTCVQPWRRTARVSGRCVAPQAGEKAGRGKVVFLTVLIVLLLGAGTALGYTYATGTVFRGVTAGTVEVGGLSLAAAQQKIAEEVGPVVDSAVITSRFMTQTTPFPSRT